MFWVTYSFESCPGTNRGVSGAQAFYTPMARARGLHYRSQAAEAQENRLKIDTALPPRRKVAVLRTSCVIYKKNLGACFRTWNLFVICRAFFLNVRTPLASNLHDLVKLFYGQAKETHK